MYDLLLDYFAVDDDFLEHRLCVRILLHVFSDARVLAFVLIFNGFILLQKLDLLTNVSDM